MSERTRAVLAEVSHYGGLSMFFAIYLSLCYVMTASVITTYPQETPELGQPIVNTPTAQAAELARVELVNTAIAAALPPESEVIGQTVEVVTPATSPSINPPVSPPQTDPAPSPLGHVVQPVLSLIQSQQISLKKLLDSL